MSFRITACAVLVALICGVSGFSSALAQDQPGQGEEPPAKPQSQDAEEPPPRQDVADTEAKDEAATPAGTPNALQFLLGELFDPGGSSGAMEALRHRKRADPRAPFNQKLSTLLKQAQSHFQAGRHRQSLEALQRLLEMPEDALWEASPGKLISVRSAAHKLLGKLPAEELERYRTQFGDAAARELQQAQQSGSAAALAQVATRYFQTDAGFQAANQLGTRYLDRGEFGLAAFWFRELLESSAPLTKNPAWRMKAEYVALKVDSTPLKKLLASSQPTGTQRLIVGGQLVSREQWLAAQAVTSSDPTPALQDWPQFFGTARRVGQIAVGEPLLLPRWSIPMTFSLAIRERVTQLITDLRDQSQVPIFTFNPLLVDGKIVYRSLRGVKVVAASTGELLWETADEPAVEDVLAAGGADGVGFFEQEFAPQFAQMFAPAGQSDVLDAIPASDNPLTHLLFRNSNHGLLSSDGRRLFVVEDLSVMSNLQPGQYWGEDLPEHDSLGRAVGINRLTAYDLKTGRSTWEVGGPNLNDPFELPLAGSFFFGAPVVDNGDLFVVAEKEGVIRLHALDAVTGQPRWSQVIANAQARINIDVGRQWLSAPVAVGDGVIVCPTTVGWLVAIDRSTHGILWAYRYQDLRPGDDAEPQAEVMQPAELDERWSTAPPVIVDDRVVFTPPEVSKIFCLSLSNGSERWSHKRGAALYLAGVFDGQIVTVLPTGIHFKSLKHGGQQKLLKFNPPDARPAGRGVAVQDRYYIPLTTGELATVNLKTLQFEGSAYLPATDKTELRQFGNLAMYQGMLLSLGPQGLAAFEPKLSIFAELQQQLAKDPESASAAIRQAELDLLNRQYATARTALSRVTAQKLSTELAKRHRTALVTALTALVRQNLNGGDTEFEQLSKLATQPEDQQQVERLRAERLVSRGDLTGAFAVYAQFAETFGSRLLTIQDVPQWQARADCWAAGKIADLVRTAPPDARQALDPLIERAVAAAPAEDRERQLRLFKLYRGHPAVIPLAQQLVEGYAAAKEWQLAENLLLSLQSEPAQRVWTRERLARLWQQARFDADAAHFYQLLERDDAGAMWDATRTVGQFLQEQRAAGKLPAPLTQPLCDWHNRDLVAMRAGSNSDGGGATKDFNLRGAGLPFFRQHRLQFQLQDPRFEVVDAISEQRVWSLPVRSPSGGAATGAHVKVTGHQVVLFEGGAVSGLSPTERRLMWTHVVEEPADGESGIEFESGQVPSALSSLESSSGLFNQRSALGDDWAMIAAQSSTRLANQQFVFYIARRQLVALDADGGSVQWMRDGVPTGAQLLGGTKVLYVWNPADDRVSAYNPVDGSEIAIPKLASLARRAVAHVADDFILLEKETGLIGRTSKICRLQRYSPLTQQVAWSLDLPRKVQAAPLSGDRLVTIDDQGQLQLCDLETGRLQPCGVLPKVALRSDHDIYAIPTYDQLLVVVHQKSKFAIDHYPESFPSVRVAGTVYSFNLLTGAEQWKQPVPSQHLILDRLDHFPIVLFLARAFEQNGSSWKLSILAVDRQHGKKVHQSEIQVPTSFHQLSVNMQSEYVELRTYNDRLRLVGK